MFRVHGRNLPEDYGSLKGMPIRANEWWSSQQQILGKKLDFLSLLCKQSRRKKTGTKLIVLFWLCPSVYVCTSLVYFRNIYSTSSSQIKKYRKRAHFDLRFLVPVFTNKDEHGEHCHDASSRR